MSDIDRLEADVRTALGDLRCAVGVPENLTLAPHLNGKDCVSYTLSGFTDEAFETAGGKTAVETLEAWHNLNPTGASLVDQKRERARNLLREAHDLEISLQSHV